LSSPPPSPTPSAPPAPAAAASPPTPASPDGTAPKTPEPATVTARPDGIPDSYWDTETNALKVSPEDLVRDLRERDELKAFKAGEEVRRAQLPKSADEYKIELPAEFKMPPGVEFQFVKDDPILAQAREQAHAMGASQEDFSKMLGMYAAAKVGEESRITAAKAAEIGKLGANAEARVNNVVQFLTGIDSTSDKRDAQALAGMMVTAGQVEAFERLITRFTTQGSAGFSASHRVEPDTKEIPGWKDMSFEQRRLAQDKQRAGASR
jgi:hypothetical protein